MKNIYTLILVIVCHFAVAQNTDQEYDQLMSKFAREDGPGAVALIVKDGNVVYRKAFGMANTELGVKLTPEHVFRIGSITKQFTASAILKLEEEGKLSVQDDITKYIKDFPTHGYTITIEHLLTHSSGIKSYTGMADWTAEVRKKDFTPLELIDFFKKEPMDFAPGTEFKYNNSGYFMLGHIIEVVSGKKYEQYLQDNFFVPLGMKNTYYDSPTRLINNRAAGYEKDGESFTNAPYLSMSQPYAAGSLISTLDDLNTWYAAVMSSKVISQSSREKAHRPYVLSNGKKTGYGYGWGIGNIQGSPMIGHGGGINGFLTASLYLPNDKLFVAVFTNCGCEGPGEVANKMAAVAIGKPFEWKKIAIADKAMEEYQAVYTSVDDGDRVITYKEGKLFSMRTGGSRYEIFPYDKDKFYIEEGLTTLHFIRGAKNKITSVIGRSTGMDVTWTRTDKPIPEMKEVALDDRYLEQYLGKYELAPNFILSIFSEGDKLYAQATGQIKIAIVAVEKHKFALVNVDAKILFNFEGEKVVSLTLFQNGEHVAKKIE